ADEPTRARGGGGARRHRRRGGRGRGGGERGGFRVAADLGRAGLRGVPPRDGGGDRAACDTGSPRTRARRGRSDSRQRLARREPGMKIAATLTVNGTAYPVELEPQTSLLSAVREAVGLTGSKE